MDNSSFNLEDVSQILIGAAVLAVPIAFSEEAWLMGETLKWSNIAMVTLISMAFLTIYVYQSIFQGNIRFRIMTYVARIVLTYLITVFVVALILYALDKLPVLTDPTTALKRIIIITLPASMGGVIIDSFDKE